VLVHGQCLELIHDSRAHLHQPMPVPQQLSQIPILRTRNPDFRKAIFQQQLQQQSSILAVGLRLPNTLGFNLGRIPNPQLETKFRQQSLEPTCTPGSLHAYPHADSSLLQIAIELLSLSLTVVQSSFLNFTSLFDQKRNLLKARMIIHAYNHHNRLLSPEPSVVDNKSLLGSRSRPRLCNHLLSTLHTDDFRLDSFESGIYSLADGT